MIGTPVSHAYKGFYDYELEDQVDENYVSADQVHTPSEQLSVTIDIKTLLYPNMISTAAVILLSIMLLSKR